MINLTRRSLHRARPSPIVMNWGVLTRTRLEVDVTPRTPPDFLRDLTKYFQPMFLAFTAFVACAVFTRLAVLLMSFYSLGAIGSATHGMPFPISTLITADQVEMLQSHQEVTIWGSSLTIIPGLNRIRILGTDDAILNLEARTLCDSAPFHPFPSILILQPDPAASYQDTVRALDLARRHNENPQDCRILVMLGSETSTGSMTPGT